MIHGGHGSAWDRFFKCFSVLDILSFPALHIFWRLLHIFSLTPFSTYDRQSPSYFLQPRSLSNAKLMWVSLLLDSQNLKILVCIVILQKALKSVAFSKSVCSRRSISTSLSISLPTSLRVGVPWWSWYKRVNFTEKREQFPSCSMIKPGYHNRLCLIMNS